jgi:hypothetical protein
MTDSKLSTQRNAIFRLLNIVTDSGNAFAGNADDGNRDVGRG